MAFIGLSVDDAHSGHLRGIIDPAEAWAKLKRIYNDRATASLLKHKRELAAFIKAPNKSIAADASRLLDLKAAIEAAGHTVTDTDVVAALLNGLPSDCDIVKTIVENTTPLPALDVVLPKLVIEEAKLTAVTPIERPKAYGVYKNGYTRSPNRGFGARVNTGHNSGCNGFSGGLRPHGSRGFGGSGINGNNLR
jgi:hypothetical protein